MSETEATLHQQLQQALAQRAEWARKYHQSAGAYTALLGRVQALLRNRFSRRSERFEDADDPQQWLFDEPLNAPDRPRAPAVIDIEAHQRKRRRSVKLPESLPRVETLVPVEDGERQCGCGCGKIVINHALHERLHYVPPIYEVHVEKREVVACPKGCAGEVRTAPKPPHILPKAKMTEGLLAHLITAKLDDRQPLYHLEKQLEHRIGGGLTRRTMARALIGCHEALMPLVNLLKDAIIDYDIGALDATGLRVLKSGVGGTPVYCFRGGAPEQSAIVFEYIPSEPGRSVARWFEGFSGTLHCDADTVFGPLLARGAVRASYCNAHARRKFEPIAQASQGEGLAVEALRWYKRLYAVEGKATRETMTPEQRHALRQRHSKPILDDFNAWAVEVQPLVPPRSSLGKAFNYVASHWEGLCEFVTDGRLAIDNNLTEQQIKPFVIARKNFLFADTEAGARALCTHFSLLRTAKHHGLEPYRYFLHILREVPYCQSVEDFEALLPWRLSRDDIALNRAA
jgi:transposase